MRTVFVIGAGANVEIGMPSGELLKKEISEYLDFSGLFDDPDPKSQRVYLAMKDELNDEEQIRNIALTIREAMPHAISIDNFIDAHRNEPGIEIGSKIAIVDSILTAEKQSLLFYPKNTYNSQGEISKTWYPLFFQKIAEGCEINEFIKRLKDISFIIFNYDRCFEQYMALAIQAYYRIGDRAKEIVKQMNIIHPYGTIGDLDHIPLGETPNFALLLKAFYNIRTFAENSEQTKMERISITQIMNKVNRIVFLGFAYHPMNLELIFKSVYEPVSPPSLITVSEHIECYGTGYKISENDREHLQELLKRKCSRIDKCEISDDLCADFFKNFAYRLSFIN